jgi:hypothetical protein
LCVLWVGFCARLSRTKNPTFVDKLLSGFYFSPVAARQGRAYDWPDFIRNPV